MLIGIYSNRQRDKDSAVTKKTVALVKSYGIDCFVDDGMHFHDSCDEPQLRPDVVIVIGGDGTMLSATRKYARTGCLFVGINMGRVGFLLQNETHSIEDAIARVVKGNYSVEDRMMLRARLTDSRGNYIKTAYALNDIIVSQRNVLKLVNLEIKINDEVATRPDCDGAIVSTPTGSTGYSMSAGGPIVYPTIDVILVTPICAHTISAKSYVISGSDSVTVKEVRTEELTSMVADGITVCDIPTGHSVVINKADFKAKFIYFAGKNFFATYREKLAEWNFR